MHKGDEIVKKQVTVGNYVALAVLVLAHSLAFSLFAQDIHFSQFFAAPMNYNPALAGQFDGDFRAIGNQRTQWRSVTVPYLTIGGSVDAHDLLEKEGLGGGISLYQDRAGDSRLNTIQFNLAGSYAIPISRDDMRAAAGAHLGFTAQSIDYGALQWDNQWNGTAFDPTAGSGEPTGQTSHLYPNLNVGAVYYYQPRERQLFTVGLSFFNLTTPPQSWQNELGVDLDLRTNFHASARLPINDEIDAEPALLLQFQGTYQEVILGASGKYLLDKQPGIYRTVFAGMYYRTRDAGYILAGMDYDQWRFGISYDVNLSGLRPASNGRGGFEISVQYIWRKFKPDLLKKKVCREFL